MAEEDNDIPVRPDVDARASAIVKSEDAAKQALARMTGKPDNEETYWCMGCGFQTEPDNPRKIAYPSGLTLQFEPDEIAALDGDLTNYTGPCPCCNCMTLVPKSKFGGETIVGTSRKQVEAEQRQAAKVFIDEAKQQIANGSIFSGSMAPAADAADAEAGHPPEGYGGDLPDAGDVNESDLKPRKP